MAKHSNWVGAGAFVLALLLSTASIAQDYSMPETPSPVAAVQEMLNNPWAFRERAPGVSWKSWKKKAAWNRSHRTIHVIAATSSNNRPPMKTFP